MSKITNQTEKDILLEKMAADRRRLAEALSDGTPADPLSKGWVSTTALTAGAMVGWPSFLRKPLRAMAAMSWRERLKEVLSQGTARYRHRRTPDPEIVRLAQLTDDLRFAVERNAETDEIARIQRELDEHMDRLRAKKQQVS